MRNDQQQNGKKMRFFGLGFVFPYLKRHRKTLVLLVISSLLCGILEAVRPLFQRYAINHFIGRQTLDTLWIFIAVYVLTLIGTAACSGYNTFITNKLEVTLNYDMRRKTFDHLQELSLSYYNQNGVGYIHSRLMSDIGRIGALASWTLMQLLWDGSYLLYIIIIMFTINWKLALLMMAMIPIEAVVGFYFQHHLAAANRRVREANSRITANYNEGITGAKTIKTLVAQERVERTFTHDTDHMYHQAVRVGRYRGALQGIIGLAGNVGLALILWRGGILTMENALDIGTLSLFTSYAIVLGGCVMSVVNVLENLINCQVNIERVDRLNNTQPDVQDTPEVIEKYGTSLEPKKENWEPLHGDVEFRDVTFRYPDGKEIVLSHFDLTVPQGTSVAIVGETGAGKSTLVNLVCRFFEPTEGQVLIDGRDARERSQLWLHANIGYVLQTPHLFSGTVLENLRYGNPDATMEQIEAACKSVCADQVIARMENGYDSQVGEGGDLLSTGEKQLLSFARAILADPRILVLDEATSSVDTITEQLIQEAIEKMTAGRTSFMIAHRLSTIRSADLILVVKDGQIVERGTHNELLRAKGAYYHLYTRQFETESAASLLN